MYRSLEEIEVRKAELREEITQKRNSINKLWNGMFHAKPEPLFLTPTQRFMKYAKLGTGALDGAILGWKLYRRFRKRNKK